MVPVAVRGTPAPSSDGSQTADSFVGRRALWGPDLDAWLSDEPEGPVLPYLYAKVKTPAAPRLHRVPTASEEQRIARAAQGKGQWPAVVQQQMKGIYFVAFDRDLERDGQRLLRTVDSRYVRQQDLRFVDPPRMHGEKLGGAVKLPLAFVYGQDCRAYRRFRKGYVPWGVARKHSRFPVRRTFKQKGSTFVEGPWGLVLPAEALRIARAVKRPADVPKGAKWVHVDLTQQTLVAYEGDKPVFATLVSSGRKGYEPPTGLFRIRVKYVNADMDGPDPDEGWYEVQEVPWTMYYHNGYALHGAYWHDDFGKERSHGCTNLAPADARWLFNWSEPEVPEGKICRVKTGTHFYFTNKGKGTGKGS